jgi:branched-chain amino acid transport system ATP-binding protein
MTSAATQLQAPVLALNDVTAGYAGTIVLRGVSLDIARGSVVALLGPNGAGKTTLLRVAAGIVRPARGSVQLRGHDVTRRGTTARARARLCLIPEGRGIFPSLTVQDNIFVTVKRQERAAAVEKVTSVFPALRDRLKQVAGTLSGGQQQMVAMARCYLVSPEVILLDEVSIGLAPKIVNEIYETIGDLAAAGTSLLLVEQYVDRALAIANTVHVLNRGSIAFSGSPRSISRAELMQKYLHLETPIATTPAAAPPAGRPPSADGEPSGQPPSYVEQQEQ